jgi:argininosuccinate lyase
LKDTDKSASSAEPTERFPSPVYADTVLAVNFDDAKNYFLDALLDIEVTHTLMLARQGIMPEREARLCLEALGKLDRAAILAERYDGHCEDLFFYIEDALARACGADVAGKMHTARSRNDIDLTMYRLRLRGEVLRIASETLAARQVLMDLAAAHTETVMPAYTHTQPAQPTTFAHYLLAAIECLGRDALRLRAAFATVNRSPLGACAITTTGFPIDRGYTASLLGFEGLQTNSYGAIAAIDYVTETVGVIATLMVNLGKLVQDLLLWCTAEYGYLRLSDAYVQISSIMPQKRNPVALEHTRILASKTLGQAQAILTCAHNTPFGDIVDSEDDLQPLLFSMCRDASRALLLFAGLMSKVEVDTERMRRRASENFITVTELADSLVRGEDMSFRLAHQLVAAAVRASGCDFAPGKIVAELERLAPQMLGRPLRKRRETWLAALDPVHFTRIREIPGGPGPKAVQAQLAAAREEQQEMRGYLDGKRALLKSAAELSRVAISALEKAVR